MWLIAMWPYSFTHQYLLSSKRISNYDGSNKHEIIFRGKKYNSPHGSLFQLFSDNLFCQISNDRQLLFQAELVATHERLYYVPNIVSLPVGETYTSSSC